MITKRVQYRYDSVRNKIGMTDADGGLHTYTYDVMRRLAGVINPLGERTTYAYDLNGRRTSVQLANGTRTSYVYDVASRVQMVHTLKSDDSTVSKFEYEYDGNGRRTSVLEADGSRVTWTYDRISQVTSEWRTGTNPYRHTFTYDKVGNRTLKIEDGQRTTLVYDACNQLLNSEDNSGTTTFTYDGNGNQTVVQKPNGDRTTQIWDYENRLVKTVQPSGGVTSMAYDADGLRVKLEEPTGTKLFVWDDQNYLAETDAAGATETAFTTEPSTYGGLISHRKAGASTTYHFDALGSTRALTDASETVLERYNYGAFGTLLGSPTLLTPFLWGGMVGYYWDADLATQYIRARHYQPAIARWISLDPIGFAGGDANLYRYIGNSPTSGGTGEAVQLKALAYGNLHIVIASSVLDYLLFDGANAYPTSMFSSAITLTDPSGLLWIVIRPVGINTLTNIGCQKTARAQWKFELDEKAPCNGFIIQKITVSCDIADCGKDISRGRFSYFEVWPIRERQTKVQDLNPVDGGPTYTDRSNFNILDNTFGTLDVTGDVKFFCNEDVMVAKGSGKNTDSRRLPDGFEHQEKDYLFGKETRCPAGPGLLGSAPGGQEPSWWNQSKAVFASRGFEGSWDCCKSCPTKYRHGDFSAYPA